MAAERSLLFCNSTATMPADTNTKRRRLSSSEYSFTQNPKPDWSQLHQELLELILSKLSFIQIIRFKAVCSSWNSIAQSFISSSIYNPLISQTPLLLLPAFDQGYYPYINDTLCFFSLEDKKKYYIDNRGINFGEDDSLCIGSSHGWLVILDEEAKPFLLNPFSQVRIQLPLTDSFMFKVEESHRIKWVSKVCISKAVLSSDPSHDNNYGTIVLIYENYASKLVFCKKGDSTWSTILDGAPCNRGYYDIVFYNDLLYALTSNNSIEIWHFHGSFPVKKKEINPSMAETTEYYRGSHYCLKYLVESCGDLLLVKRFIGEDEVIDEAYLPSDESTQPLVFPYRTRMLYVYKLDSKEQKWVEVDNLKSHALFLGCNHSMSVSAQNFSGCEKNYIYFTDDNWLRMIDDPFYGGHDLVKFSLEQKIVKPFCGLLSEEYRVIDPPPFWIIPKLR